MQAIIGISVDQVTSASDVPAFRLGTVGGYDHPELGNQQFVYGKASGAIAGRGYLAVEGADGWVALDSTTANAGAQGHGSRIGAAQAALTNGQYGWFQVYGKGGVRVGASAAKGTRLNTTATAGQVDDDGTAAAEVVNGLVLQVAQAASAGVNESGMFNYPSVGATLT